MGQINTLPRFADDVSADVTEPTEAKKDVGWVGGATPDRPPAQFFNWLHRTTFENIEFLRDILIFNDTQQWTFQTTSLGQNLLTGGIAYDPVGDVFVWAGRDAAVDGRVYESPDGTTWTLRDTDATNFWDNVMWDEVNSKFIVVGGQLIEAGVLTSADGITWVDRSAQASTANEQFTCIDFDATSALYVAAGSDGRIATTTNPDSVAWTNRTSGSATQDFESLASDGADTVIAFGINPGHDYHRSVDGGATWLRLSDSGLSGIFDDGYATIWEPESATFIIAGQDIAGGGLIAWSTDGQHTNSGGTWNLLRAVDTGITEPIRSIQRSSQPVEDKHFLVTTESGGVWAGFIDFVTAANVNTWTNRPVPFTSSQTIHDCRQKTEGLITTHFWVIGGDGLDSSGDDVIAKSQTPLF